jgi:hypothetical protein
MRPLPADKKHGIIHTVPKEHLDKIADILGIQGKERARLYSGDVHIVREAADTEIKKD